MKYRFIMQNRHQCAVGLQCRVLGVSVSGYYAWRRRGKSRRAQQDQRLVVRIRAVFEQHRHRYGSPRVHRELQEQGMGCSRKRVARLMRAAGLRARDKRRFKRTTNSAHPYPVAPNHLARSFTPAQIGGLDRVWAGDITYLATREGWLYLAVLLDLYSRRVVGWSIGSSLEQNLTRQALGSALALRQPADGLLHHSDRGSQYAAVEYQGQLTRKGILCSMSRTGNCWDNAPVESFFATLKQELGSEFNGCFGSREQARQEVGRYIESYYNRQRRHSTLGYLSPAQFEQQCLTTGA